MRPLLRLELLSILRDRRTLFVSVLLPIILLPLLAIGCQRFAQQASKTEKMDGYRVVYEGPGSEALRATIEQFADPGPDPSLFQEVEVPAGGADDPGQALLDGRVDLIVQIENEASERDSGSYQEEYLDAPPQPAPTATPGEREAVIFAERQPGCPLVKLNVVDNRDRSAEAGRRFTQLLQSVVRNYRDARLESRGVHARSFLSWTVVDTPRKHEKASRRAGAPMFFPLILLALLVGSGSVAAVDSLAGERERGSWETLLSSCLSCRQVIAAKHASVTLTACVITGIQLANLAFSWRMGWLKLPQGLSLAVAPLIAGLALGLGLVLAHLTSSISLYASARSRSFKEAQLLFFPLFVLCLALGSASLFPDLPQRSLIALIPIAGLNVAMRHILSGDIDPLLLITVLVVNLGASLAFLQASSNQIRSYGDEASLDVDNPEEQKRLNLREHVGWVYALMAAAIVIVPGNVPFLATLVGQVLFNQGMLLIVCLSLLHECSISARRALRIRRVPILVALLALGFGPLLQLCATGLVLATQSVLPVPEEMTRQMSQFIVPQGVPLPILLVLLAFGPALCEEIAFRGVFMYAFLPPAFAQTPPPLTLRRGFPCAALVGLVFGLFHLSIYRFLPTAVIGMFLALLSLECGSIVPGILAHCCNNGVAVWLERAQVDLAQAPIWLLVAAWPATAALLLIIGVLCRRSVR